MGNRPIFSLFRSKSGEFDRINGMEHTVLGIFLSLILIKLIFSNKYHFLGNNLVSP